MDKKIIGLLISVWLLTLSNSINRVAGEVLTVNPIVTPQTLTARETINITNPVKSAAELLTIISDSLDSVCATLTLTVNNTGKWFDSQRFSKCIDKAVQKSLIGGPYYHSCKYNSSTYDNRTIKLSVRFNYRFPRKILIQAINETEIKAVNIVNSIISPDMSGYEKEKTVHDYIINHTGYDEAHYRNDTVPPESYTPYGILVKGTGVCQGYAEAVRLLLNKAGIECITVSGLSDGISHAWNIVKIGGEYYHLDVTLDDPVPDGQLSYNYFNLNDEMIAVNHSWDQKGYPKCGATEFNYYQINGLLVEDMKECKRRIQQAIDRQQDNINLKVLKYNPVTFKKDIISMIGRLNYMGTCTYSCDSDLGTVKIELKYNNS